MFWWENVFSDTSSVFKMVKYGTLKKKSKSLAQF